MSNRHISPRLIVSWVLSALVVVGIVPVGGQFFIELAREQGIFEKPTSKIEDAINWLTPIVESWYFAAIIGFFLGIAVTLWFDYLNRKRTGRDEQRPRQAASLAGADQFDEAGQQRLLAALKQYSGDFYNLDIEFANVKHRQLAETIESVFWLAGWKTNSNSLPQENYQPHHYWRGVHVWGYNRHLVNSIAQSMSDSGIIGVRSSIEVSKIAKDNPKWPYVEHRIKIRVGHQEY
jgi:hypothetical protein